VNERRPALGVAAIVGASACFAALDTTTRYLGAFLAVQVMLWSRYALHTLVMGAWIALDRRKSFRTEHPGFQALRGALLLTASTLAFFALQHLPVAEFTAIVMLTPILVTLLAGWWLREDVSPLRWALVIGGFIGVLIIIRPGSGLFGWAVVLPFGAALANAVFQLISSHFAARESAFTTNFYTGLVGIVVLTPILLATSADLQASLVGQPASRLVLLLLLGVFGTAGHLLLVSSLGMAPTATLMPFLYTQIAFAALGGWLVFRRTPDSWSWLGMCVIAVCGALSAFQNMRRRVPPVVAATIAD
jgi:drug/metabolite transporter (DMT)-like permease